MDLYLNVGSQKIVVNPWRITGVMSETLYGKIEDVIMNSLFKEFPPLAGETREAYNARYAKWVEEKKEAAKKKDEAPKKGKKTAAEPEAAEDEPENETLKEFVRRQLNLTKYEDQMNYLYDCVKAIAETFDNQGHKADIKALKDCPLIEVNNFVFKVCKYARVPISLEEITLESYDY